MSVALEKRTENEVSHGRYLLEHGAGDVWNWESPAGRLRWARRVEMLAGSVTPGMRVLEIGCGTGYFTRELARTAARIVAIDVSPDLLAAARAAISAENVSFELVSAHALSFADASFDCVLGSSVLHHLDCRLALPELLRVLRPGGFLLFTEPNMANPQIALQKNIPFLKRLAGDSPDETAFFRWRIVRQLTETGFADATATPFDFLHPSIPGALLPLAKPIAALAERLPLVREIAGSLRIRAVRPRGRP
jgi:SAM-dependent methyltransferase